ncbi:RNA polymerase II transcriptional coactivator KELP [Silene latifolia]|uniref:RNA polymerase II transcriptional coactivator KELP n=1 Tax=Silene latifolia TaxID=37657 RepID=UPI003D775CE5
MDARMEKKIEESVLEILETSDMQEMTEYKVRKLAAEKLGIDLSEPSRKKFVRHVVETFLEQQAQQQQQNDAVQGGQVEENASEEEEEKEEEGSNSLADGKEYDDDGDLIICRLSEKRRVTIQDFRGKTLVSIREFYKKDGKFLPTSKGISLTAEQWSSFKKNVPAIDQAIKEMEDRL